MSRIKAIQTFFDGYRFRSRLEARWAVFFKTLNIRYTYESEGYDLGGVWYLPDFYLPDYDYWIEVKPVEINRGSRDWAKVRSLAGYLGKIVYVAIGDCWFPYNGNPGHGEIANYHMPIRPDGSAASHHWWIDCGNCHRLSLVVFGHSNYCECRDQGAPINWSNSPRLINAYKTARAARFEHGEIPGIDCQSASDNGLEA